jgi:predicted amidohydrolase YtcJ
MTNYAIIENGLVTNVYVSDAPLNEADVQSDTAQIGWSYANGVFTAPTAPTPTAAQLLAAFISQVQSALDESDKTMMRVQEAISLGLTTATTADVVAYVNYRRALRALLASTTVGVLPTKPAYPVGS